MISPRRSHGPRTGATCNSPIQHRHDTNGLVLLAIVSIEIARIEIAIEIVYSFLRDVLLMSLFVLLPLSVTDYYLCSLTMADGSSH